MRAAAGGGGGGGGGGGAEPTALLKRPCTELLEMAQRVSTAAMGTGDRGGVMKKSEMETVMQESFYFRSRG